MDAWMGREMAGRRDVWIAGWVDRWTDWILYEHAGQVFLPHRATPDP